MRKWAQEVFQKAAVSPVTDFVGAMVGDALIPANGLTGVIGAAATEQSPEDFIEDDLSTAASFIPGYGGYRLGQRMGVTSNEFADDRAKAGRGSKLMHEYLGAVTNPLMLGLAGAGAGLGYGHLSGDTRTEDLVAKALLGGLGGVGVGALGQLLATGGAAITKTRTKDEQREEDVEGSVLSNYLLPGSGMYDLYKRLGYSRRYDKEREARKTKDKKYAKKNTKTTRVSLA